MQLKLNLALVSLMILGVLLNFGYATPVVYSQSIQDKISDIQSRLDSTSGTLNDVTSIKDTLQEELDSINSEIKNTEELISDTEQVMELLSKDIENNQDDVASLETEIKSLLIEIQKQKNISPVQNILSSRGLDDILTKVYGLTTLEDQASTLRTEIEEATNQLEKSKSDQEDVRQKLIESKVLVESKKAEVVGLIQTYGNQESEYARQIAALKTEQDELESDLARKQTEFESGQGGQNRNISFP